MKHVIVHYNDGTTKSYTQIKDAERELFITKAVLHSMARATNHRTRMLMQALHIEQVEIVDSGLTRGRTNDSRRAGKRCPVVCTKEDGTVYRTASQAEARRVTGLPISISYYLDDGKYHQGWRFDSGQAPARQPARIVTEEEIALIYRYTKHYLYHHTKLGWANYQDVWQAIAASVVQSLASGAYEAGGAEYSLKSWLYLRIKHYAYVHLQKMYQYIQSIEDDPCPGQDMDTWLSDRAAKPEPDLTFEWIPVEYRELAIAMASGYTAREIETMLRIGCRKRRQMVNELKKWLIDNDYHKGDDNDERE